MASEREARLPLDELHCSSTVFILPRQHVPLPATRDALLATDFGGDGVLMVLDIDYPHGEYRPGDQLWLRQLDPAELGRAINRDVLVPKKGGRFAFGRLIDRQGSLVGLLPPGHGEKQQIVDNPAWVAVAEMLVRRL